MFSFVLLCKNVILFGFVFQNFCFDLFYLVLFLKSFALFCFAKLLFYFVLFYGFVSFLHFSWTVMKVSVVTLDKVYSTYQDFSFALALAWVVQFFEQKIYVYHNETFQYHIF